MTQVKEQTMQTKVVCHRCKNETSDARPLAGGKNCYCPKCLIIVEKESRKK